jgi:hypothetical protein
VSKCTLLDIAVGCGAVEVAKCLLEFHEATPTRETLKMALSSGNLVLIRLLWERLPAEQERRLDLLEVTGDYHWEEPLAWLLRDAKAMEVELFLMTVIERRQADAVLTAKAIGLRPWSEHAKELALSWTETKVEFGSPPEGVLATSGWLVDVDDEVVTLPAKPRHGWTLPWTIDRSRVQRLAIPCVFALDYCAASDCRLLTSVLVPPTVSRYGDSAFKGCYALREACFGRAVRELGFGAFRDCSSVTRAVIPAGVYWITAAVFEGCWGLSELVLHDGIEYISGRWDCTSLRELIIPPRVQWIAECSFEDCPCRTRLDIPRA